MEIKLCGLTREEDIKCANELVPGFIGFVFWRPSKRYISPEKAIKLKQMLLPKIKAVGVFVDEDVKVIADYLNRGIIDVAQLHGSEDETYIKRLRVLTVRSRDDLPGIKSSSADYVLLDSGTGSGNVFDWDLIKSIERPYFLAGGLNTTNVEEAIRTIKPYAIDVSSGIETEGKKDPEKMKEFVSIARKVNERIRGR